MTFISFIADHPLGEEIEAVVETFTSHGAVVRAGELRAYVPLAGLGDPAPRTARGILHKGETRRFVVTALDPYRRGVELALPGVGVVSGHPSEETVAAVVKMARAQPTKAAAPRARRARAKKAPVAKIAPPVPPQQAAKAGRSPAAKAPVTAPRARRGVAPKPAAPAVAEMAAGPRRSPRAKAAAGADRVEAAKAAPRRRRSR
jgi:hypothetical protein